MFQKERYEEIYNILQDKQSATVQYLVNQLHISEATVRRDLSEMESMGLLQRVWGGAMLQATADKGQPTFVRVKSNTDKKARIAAIASGLINESSSIFIDGSTTAKTSIQNSTVDAYEAYHGCESSVGDVVSKNNQQMLIEQTSSNVYMIGGQIYEKRITTGPLAIADVRKFYADILFFSCNGISAESGISCIESKCSEVCAEMMLRAGKKVLLCDSTKAGKNYLWHIADFDEIDYVIMDEEPDDPALVSALGKKLITDPGQL